MASSLKLQNPDAQDIRVYLPRFPRWTLSESLRSLSLARLKPKDAQAGAGVGPFSARLENLSAKGAAFLIPESKAMYRSLGPGSRIILEMPTPENDRIAVHAEIVRVEPDLQSEQDPDQVQVHNRHEGQRQWKIAVRFVNLDRRVFRKLDREVTSRSNDFSHPLNFDHAVQLGSKAAEPRAFRAQLWGWVRLLRRLLAARRPGAN